METKVDSKAAPCTDPDLELRAAMQSLKPARSKPTPGSAVAKATPKTKKAKTKSVKPVGLENKFPNEKFDLKGSSPSRNNDSSNCI